MARRHHWAIRLPHKTDVVYAPRAGLFYVDNVKTGSSTVRTLLETPFGVERRARKKTSGIDILPLLQDPDALRQAQAALLARCPSADCEAVCQRALGEPWGGADWWVANFRKSSRQSRVQKPCVPLPPADTLRSLCDFDGARQRLGD